MAWNRTYETVRPHQALGYLSAARQARPQTSSITNGSILMPHERRSCPICPDPIQGIDSFAGALLDSGRVEREVVDVGVLRGLRA